MNNARIALAIFAILGACATSEEKPAQSSGSAPGCVPGDSKECACGGGQTGAQVCMPDGKSYGECGQCSGGGGGSGGATGSGGQSIVCQPAEAKPCYSGEAGTNGVGPCHGGTTTCNAQGTGWGPCVGEVPPSFDNCTTAADEDCSGSSPSCTGTSLWVRRAGDAALQTAVSVAVDQAGNTVIAGYFQGSFDLGLGTLTSAGATDVFVAKFDPFGSPLWAKTFGDVDIQRAESVAIDTHGNILLTGRFYNSVDFGGGLLTSAGASDMFVVKLSPSGAHIFSKRFGADNEQIGLAITSDSLDNILVTGNFIGGLDLGGGPLMSSSWDVFVAKLDPSGSYIWAHRYGDVPEGQFARAIAVDATGSVAVTGNFRGSLDFGNGTLTSSGTNDIFVAKLDSNGNALWSKRFGDGQEQEGHAIAVAPDGNVIIAGVMQGSVDFGSGVLTSANADDAFLAAFTAAGSPLWSNRFGGLNGEWVTAVATDGAGNIHLGGSFSVSIDFGGGSLSGLGADDAFIAKFEPSGKYLWSHAFQAAGYQNVNAVATLNDGHVAVAGQFEQTVNFGAATLTSGGGFDMYVGLLAP